MALSNREYVGRALEQLNEGLRPFFERELRSCYGDNWEEVARSRLTERQGSRSSTWDVTAMIGVMMSPSEPTFHRFAQANKSALSECRQMRNDWAHFDILTPEYTHHALDSIRHILRLVRASRQATRVERLKQQFNEQQERERQEMEATPLTRGMGRAGGPRELVERFLESYLGTPKTPAPFGGRQAELVALDSWLEAPPAPLGLLVAPAGRGKSALVSQWVSRLTQTRRADVVFVPISLRFHLTERNSMLRLLGGRLALLTQPDTEQPDDPDGWAAEIQMMLRRDRPAGSAPLLVVLDGLDEAVGWEVGRDLILPKALGRGVRMLVTARALAGCDADGWRERLGWEPARTHMFNLLALDLTGVAEVLRSLGPAASAIAAQADVQRELLRLSEGDPLLVRLYADALRESASNMAPLTAASLAQLPPGLEGYMQRWWDEQRTLWGAASPLREPAVRVVLNLMSCALGPLLADDLLELARPEGLDSWLLNDAIRSLARLIVGDGSVQGYAFSHARLGHYLADQLQPREQAQWAQRFLDYGAQTLQQLQDGALAPAAAPAYCLRYYRAHLDAAGADLARVSILLSEPWLRAWEALDSTYDGFLVDVRAIWSQADAALLAGEGDTLLAISVQCRCLLTWTSINSLGANIPSELLVELVTTGLWSHTDAIARISRIPDEETQAKYLATLAPFLREDVLEFALTHVRTRMRHPLPRVLALMALAQRVPDSERPTLWREAHALALDIPDRIDRAEQLSALAQHLPGEVHLERALADAVKAYASADRMSTDKFFEYQIGFKGEQRVRWLLEHLPGPLLSDAITMIATNPRTYLDPWDWLTPILHRLPPQALPPLCDLLLQTVGNTPAGERHSSSDEVSTSPPTASFLRSALPWLSEADRELVIEAQLEVLDTASAARIDELVPAFRPWCTPDQVKRADGLLQRRPLSQNNQRLLEDAISAYADAVIDGRPVSGRPIQQILIRARMLAQLAQDETLAHQQDDVTALYAEALALPHAADRAHGLLAITALLTETERPSAARFALAAIDAIPPLTPELEERYLQIARRPRLALLKITDDEEAVILAESDHSYRARALVAAASYLPPQERLPALLEVCSLLQARCPDAIWVWGREGLIRQLLDVGCLDKALEVLQLIPPDREEESDSIAAAITMMTETLAERDELAGVLPRLVNAAQRIGNRTDKTSALFTLAQAAPAQERREILQAVARAASVIDDGPERVDLLLHLARHVPEDSREMLLRELLRQIEHLPLKLADRGDHIRQEAVDDLVSILPDPILAEEHTAILNMCSEELEVEILERLAPLLPLRELRAIALARAPFVKDDEGPWLQTLVRRLVAEESEPAVRDLIASLSEAGDRAWLLSMLATSLGHPRAAVVLEEVIDDISLLNDADGLLPELYGTSRVRAIETLCSSLPDELLQLVAGRIPSLLAEEKRNPLAFVLKASAVGLSPANCVTALEMIRSADSDTVAGLALTELIPHLPASLLDDALGLIRDLSDGYARCRALIVVADQLAGDAREELLLEALQALRNPSRGWSLDSNAANISLTQPQSEAARTLLSLIQALPPARYADVLKVARSLEPDTVRANALAVLAPHLVPQHTAELLEAARAIVDEDARGDALVSFAFALPEPLGDDLLLEAVDIDDLVHRIWTFSLLGVAPGLSRTSQEEAIEAALALLPALEAGETQAVGVRSLAIHADDEAYTQKILDAVQQIAAPEWRAYALARVLTYLPLEAHLKLVDEALLLCQYHLQHRWRVIALKEIVAALGELSRTALLPRWNLALTSRRSLSRPALLDDLSFLIPMLSALGGRDAATALAEAVLEQGRWFP